MCLRLVCAVLALVAAVAGQAIEEDSIDTSNFNSRVVGGVVSELSGTPYIVSISLKGRQKDKQLCAGSIVGEQWIVTAAHCLKDPPYRLLITAGLHSINQTESPIIQQRRCDFYRRHENYSTIFGATGGYDIGVAHISTPFQFMKFIQPIPLHEKAEVQGIASIFGWGSISTTTDRNYPHQLQTADLTLQDVKSCELAHNTSIGVGTLCAGGEKDNRGACIGDSGGPLVQGNILIGVVSWGPPTCNPKDGPSIFSNVGYYAHWIKKQIQSDVSENNLLK